MHSQLVTELPERDGLRGLVVSASKELEPGARAMLVLAEGLFRIDVVVHGDSLRTVGAERLRVRVTIATLRFDERGTVRVSANAIMRQDPDPARSVAGRSAG